MLKEAKTVSRKDAKIAKVQEVVLYGNPEFLCALSVFA